MNIAFDRPSDPHTEDPLPYDYHILIVDDEATNRIILSTILEKDNFYFHETTNGAEALGFVERFRPDLILLDIVMPDIDGYGVCRKLKEEPGTADIPIIFITALDDSDSIIQGFDVGAVDYLTKPFNEAEVRARIHTHLKLKTATDKIRKYSEDLERIIAEETKELLKAERQAAFGQLIQGIVHNLKSPLTAIRAGAMTGTTTIGEAADLLAKTPMEEEQLIKLFRCAERSMSIIDTASKRMNDMVNMMMSRSYAHTGKVEIFDINELINEELEFLNANLFFKNKITKNIHLANEPLFTKALRAEIAQVFHNLVTNAIDSLHDVSKPGMAITTRGNNKEVIFAVSDNGEGINPENMEKIFDPLFTTKPRIGASFDNSKGPTGAGLGLYMCMRAIKAFCGKINVSSEVNQGSTFEIILPRCTKK